MRKRSELEKAFNRALMASVVVFVTILALGRIMIWISQSQLPDYILLTICVLLVAITLYLGSLFYFSWVETKRGEGDEY